MQILERIKVIPQKNEFLYWTACVANNSMADLTRVSAFVIEEDNEHITFFLPTELYKTLDPFLKTGSKMSFLMASIMDLESYQLKGVYVKHQQGTEENSNFLREKVLNIVDVLGGMGMDGKKLFNYLLGTPIVAVTMKVDEMYEQTPKPNTGERLNI